MKPSVDSLIRTVAKRREESTRKRCGGCRAVECERMLETLCARVRKQPEAFQGLRAADVAEWAGVKQPVPSWLYHVKNHRPELWKVLVTVLRRAGA